MIDAGKKSVLGVRVDAIDYEGAVARIVGAAKSGRAYRVTPLAVHGVMAGVLDREQLSRLNALELVTPDGQPVRWSLNLLHGCRLPDRVYGPALMARLLEAAERDGLSIYLYGSSDPVLERLVQTVRRRHPSLEVAGYESSRFRALTESEADTLVQRIQRSGAQLTFVGLGCPRQEVFVYEVAGRIGMPTIAVGAAFDYHAGTLREPPHWIQAIGLQWLYRLAQQPTRLWRRYLVLNPMFLLLLASQAAHLWRPNRREVQPTELRPG